MNKIAASLASKNTETCLESLHRLAPFVGFAEICLDLMDSFDLPRIVRGSPCPLIVTCRPPREGGRFSGTENERLALLAEAMSLACAYVDVEWDSVDSLLRRRRTVTKLIVSRHWLDHMPTDLCMHYEEMRGKADVVKLVGTARVATDILPVLNLWRHARTPVITLAMGEVGVATRLLAPCFEQCLLTYGALSNAEATADGQPDVREMVEKFNLHRVGCQTDLHIHLCATRQSVQAVINQNAQGDPGAALHIPILVGREEAAKMATTLPNHMPRSKLTADSSLSLPGLHDHEDIHG